MADDKDNFDDDAPTEVIDRSALKRHLEEQAESEAEAEGEE